VISSENGTNTAKESIPCSKWDDWSGYDSQQPGIILPDNDKFFSNPSGIDKPYLTGLGVLGVTEGVLYFNTDGVERPILTLKSDNYDNNNPEKLIRIQMTFSWGRDVEIEQVLPQGEITNIAYREPVEGKVTYVYSAWDIVIKPNPFSETIKFVLPGFGDETDFCNFKLDQLVLDTKCAPPVPIPGSLLLLGSGILALVGIGIRRKSA